MTTEHIQAIFAHEQVLGKQENALNWKDVCLYSVHPILHLPCTVSEIWQT